MADVEYKASREGMREMLGSSEVLSCLAEYAGQVRGRALGMVSDDDMQNDAFYSASRIDSKGMARASVYTGNPHGYNACLKDNVLLKATG